MHVELFSLHPLRSSCTLDVSYRGGEDVSFRDFEVQVSSGAIGTITEIGTHAH